MYFQALLWKDICAIANYKNKPLMNKNFFVERPLICLDSCNDIIRTDMGGWNCDLIQIHIIHLINFLAHQVKDLYFLENACSKGMYM